MEDKGKSMKEVGYSLHLLDWLHPGVKLWIDVGRGFVDSDNFFKISNKLLFILKPGSTIKSAPAAFSTGFAPDSSNMQMQTRATKWTRCSRVPH
jgi:hypothetical protein